MNKVVLETFTSDKTNEMTNFDKSGFCTMADIGRHFLIKDIVILYRVLTMLSSNFN